MGIITNIDKDTYINYWLPLAYKHPNSYFTFYTLHEMPKVIKPVNMMLLPTLAEATKYINDIAFLTQSNLIPTYETMVYLENLKRYKFINPTVQGTNESTNSFTVRNDYKGQCAIEYSMDYDLKDNTKLTVYKV